MDQPVSNARRSRRLSSTGVIVLLLSAIAGLYALLAPSTSAATGGATDPAVARGQDLFRTACSSCHGFNAEGTNEAPSLIGVGAAAVDFQVGTGRMPLAFNGPQADRKKPRFSQPQINDLAAYVASLAPGPAEPATLDLRDADLNRGAELFQANCAPCHQIAGAGGVLTYGKYAPNLYQATPKQIYEAMLTGPENMPVFGDKALPPGQKLAIVKYLSTMRALPNPGGNGIGRIGPVNEGLVVWVAAIPVLIGFMLWIGKRI